MIEVNIQRNELPSVIESFGGKFFSVNFTKKNLENRKMVCRKGVSKNVKGVGMKYNPAERGLIVVYEMKQRSHKCIPLQTMHRLVCKDIVYNVVE